MATKVKKVTKKDFFALVPGSFEESQKRIGWFYRLFEDEIFILAKIYENGPYCLFVEYYDLNDIPLNGSELYIEEKIEKVYRNMSRFIKIGKNDYIQDNCLVGFVIDKIAYVNADQNYDNNFTNEMIGPDIKENIIGFSFGCIERLDKKAIQKLVSGEMSIVDYTNEDKVSIKSQSEAKKLIETKKGSSVKLKPPGKGYSVVKIDNRYCWHKSGHVLIQDIKGEKTYLMGQDEGQYFGVELCEYCRSIGEAVESLKPIDAKPIKNVLRQGEWFLIPVKESEVPSIHDSLLWNDQYYSSFTLPKDDVDSHDHDVSYDKVRLGSNGKLYFLNPNLMHEQHQNLNWKGWAYFAKNTAVRSVSVDGVD